MNSFEMDLIHLTVAAAIVRLPFSMLLLLPVLVLVLIPVPPVRQLPYTICM